MTDTATYAKSPATTNKNEWLMTGVVIASPSTGQIKAVMPIFSSYADIRIENILPIDSHTLSPDEPILNSAGPTLEAATSVGERPELDAKLHVQEEKLTLGTTKWRAIMRIGTSMDLQHLSVMVGLASLAGALTNIVFGAIADVPAPQPLVIAITAIGFLGGRFLSDRLRAHRHG